MNRRRAMSMAMIAGLAAPAAAAIGVVQSAPAAAAPEDCEPYAPVASTVPDGNVLNSGIIWGYQKCEFTQTYEACLQIADSPNGPFANWRYTDDTGTGDACFRPGAGIVELSSKDRCALGAHFYRTHLSGNFKASSAVTEITGFKRDGYYPIECTDNI